MMIDRFFATALVFCASLAPLPALAQAQNEPDVDAIEIEAPPIAQPVDMRLTVDIDQSVDRENLLFLDLSNGRRVAIRLMPDWAPEHVNRIKTLTQQGFYDGLLFHRVIDGFMAQTGDPTGTGTSGSDLPDLEAEFNAMPHVRGTVSMARASSEDSANSQFFIMFYPRFTLDRRYTVFGRVIDGMDAVDAIERGEPPANPTRVLQASIASDNRPQAMAPAEPVPAPASAAGAVISDLPVLPVTSN